MQEAAGSYFTTMVTRIQSVPGYTSQTPVLFVNYDHSLEDTVFTYPEFAQEVNVYPYNIDSLTTDYNWLNLMTVLTGFEPGFAEISDISDTDAIEEMPFYPDDGSVKMVNDVVVIKLRAK
jgi:hypothetical protein